MQRTERWTNAADGGSYDVVCVGTGFATSFFLVEYLRHARPDARILVLERGGRESHRWQVEYRRHGRHDPQLMFHNQTPDKPWVFTPAFGGGSNCWWAVTPRMLPNDFRTRSQYGVGRDWPVTYDDLAPFYSEAERLMSVSGPHTRTAYPGVASYPQPPHHLTDPDMLLAAAYPEQFFPMATARARVDAEGRPRCCASGVCHLCPIDAKFTIENGLRHVYDDSRVTLRLEATVVGLNTVGAIATGVAYQVEGKTQSARADLVVLGANALFNAHILKQSGLDDLIVGTHLNEQVSVRVDLDLAGVDNFQGSTSVTGHGYMFYDGAHRAERAGCLLESWNVPPARLRMARGRWRQWMSIKLVFEDLPDARNAVVASEDDPGRPATRYFGHSDYTQRGIDAVPAIVDELAQALPIERYETERELTESHIQGTTPMGDDPSSSVVDRSLVHHRARNVVVLGSGAFPTCPPANPTLTLSALSLWSAAHLGR